MDEQTAVQPGRTSADGVAGESGPARRTAGLALCWLHQVALSVWLGGIVTLGGVVAPAVFGTAKAQGQTEWGQPLYTFAGTALTEAFRRFNLLAVAAGSTLLLAGAACGVLLGLGRVRVLGRALLSGLALGIAVWLAAGLFPRMLAAREAGAMERFDAMHRVYTSLVQAQLAALLAVAALTVWMHAGLGRGGRRGRRDAAAGP